MMTYDPIPDLVRLGYTNRESAFICLVGRTSGFFLGRQYSQFLRRKPGALIQQFVVRASAYRHIETLDYGQRRHVYHLKSKTVYRILGDEESQNRRVKGDHEITTKLMILDYVLEQSSDHFLSSPSEKVAFFKESLGISSAAMPRLGAQGRFERGTKAALIFPDRFPIYGEKTEGKQQEVRFTYFDHGTSTTKAFVRYLQRYRPLLDELGRFQLLYVACSRRNFQAAQREFARLFPTSELTADVLPFGKEHFVRFLQAQQLWDNNDAQFTQADLQSLKEGERIYCRPEHVQLSQSWAKSRHEFEARLDTICGQIRTEGRLRFHILQGAYPIFGYRYSGKPVSAVAESQIGRISGSDSIAS